MRDGNLKVVYNPVAGARVCGKVHVTGFGYGLPIAQVYAQFLGGSVELMSVHGYGTDAIVKLPAISPTLSLPM